MVQNTLKINPVDQLSSHVVAKSKSKPKTHMQNGCLTDRRYRESGLTCVRTGVRGHDKSFDLSLVLRAVCHFALFRPSSTEDQTFCWHPVSRIFSLLFAHVHNMRNNSKICGSMQKHSAKLNNMKSNALLEIKMRTLSRAKAQLLRARPWAIQGRAGKSQKA
jgi:hypothetical protein